MQTCMQACMHTEHRQPNSPRRCPVKEIGTEMVRKQDTSQTKTAKRASGGSGKKALPAAVTVAAKPLAIVEGDRGNATLQLRSLLRMPCETFARLVPISVRNLAYVEAGKEPTDTVFRRLKELQRIVDALSEVIQPEAIGSWLTRPNDAFDSLKPMEAIERGEIDRIWQMIFFLRSGVPS